MQSNFCIAFSFGLLFSAKLCHRRSFACMRVKKVLFSSLKSVKWAIIFTIDMCTRAKNFTPRTTERINLCITLCGTKFTNTPRTNPDSLRKNIRLLQCRHNLASTFRDKISTLRQPIKMCRWLAPQTTTILSEKPLDKHLPITLRKKRQQYTQLAIAPAVLGGHSNEWVCNCLC